MPTELPEEFRSRIGRDLPLYAEKLIYSLENTDPSVSARVNPLKLRDGEEISSVMPGAADSVPWCASGRYFATRPDFTHDPAFHQGRYYVQDASSMAIDRIVRFLCSRLEMPEGTQVRYLDACAAPGGKTTAAVAALLDLAADPLIVANEFDFRRAEILKENIIKWGYEGCVVTRGDTARFRGMPGFFHIIAADVPCSGEGMMRKDRKAVEQWSPALVEQCAARQREIVANLWEALAPGGYMIYSTCTFNTAENEDLLRMLVGEYGAQVLALPAGDFPGAVATESMLRFLPSQVKGEGLAIGVVYKPVEEVAGARKLRVGKRKGGNPAKKDAAAAKRLLPACRGWIGEDARYDFVLQEDTVVALPAATAAAMAQAASALDVIHMGVELGEVKGKNVVPSQALAMSRDLNRGAFPEVEVDLSVALSYLRREALGGFDAPRGCVLLTYKGMPLGFVNHLGNRSNNLYPSSWRILH